MMTPQERTDFLASFGNAFELDDDSIRAWCSTEGLPVLVQKQSIEEYTRKSTIPEKQYVTKSFSWAGPRRPLATEGELSKTTFYNDAEHFKERVSYLMPYSHKMGLEDVLPSLQLHRNRCQSMPFITPLKSPSILERQFRIFDNSDEADDEEEKTTANEDAQTSLEVIKTDGVSNAAPSTQDNV